MENSEKSQVVVIKASELDPTFKDQVARMTGGENIKYCFTCGTCTAGCPVRFIDERYNPRKIIRMILLGMKERVLKSDFIWLCSTCYTCQERCPQDVRITDLMNAVKNLAVQEGYCLPGYIDQVRILDESGMLYKIDEFVNKKREKAGLPPIPEKCEDVSKIFQITKIKEKAVRK